MFSDSLARNAVVQILEQVDVRVDGARPWDIRVLSDEFYHRFLRDIRFELGQTYMDGLWDSDQPDEFLAKLLGVREKTSLWRMAWPYWRVPHYALNAVFINSLRDVRDRLINRQTRRRALVVGKEHYDIDVELYRKMLGPTMTYTCGIWSDGGTLDDAQNAKHMKIAESLGLRPGQHVLDIGCGFGAFARFAADRFGARVTGVTISEEQLRYAQKNSATASDVRFLKCDYRDIGDHFGPESFDHVVSIEMVEAVGHKNLDEFFAIAGKHLKKGGRFALQGIAENKDVVGSNPWFDRYIFPNGAAPSIRQLDRAAAPFFGSPVSRERLTPHYDRTLMAWYENFRAAWPELQGKFDPRFERMWGFYLFSFAAGFRSETMQVYQSVYSKESV